MPKPFFARSFTPKYTRGGKGTRSLSCQPHPLPRAQERGGRVPRVPRQRSVCIASTASSGKSRPAARRRWPPFRLDSPRGATFQPPPGPSADRTRREIPVTRGSQREGRRVGTGGRHPRGLPRPVPASARSCVPCGAVSLPVPVRPTAPHQAPARRTGLLDELPSGSGLARDLEAVQPVVTVRAPAGHLLTRHRLRSSEELLRVPCQRDGGKSAGNVWVTPGRSRQDQGGRVHRAAADSLLRVP